MHGDFSRWVTEFFTNDHGILHQQGRVLLDHDINTQTVLSERWQVAAARAAFGGGIAAVQANEGESFNVLQASQQEGGASLVLEDGVVFADGLLAYLTQHPDDTVVTVDGRTGIKWFADYLGPAPAVHAAREAVILEAWHESINSFQDTALLEPALGGPDTTERLHVATSLRLVPLEADQHCSDLELHGEPLGTLSVSLDPGRTLGDPDCPIEDPGGYRGPEHHLYRVEIANVDPDREPMFKWSRFNGGLVGRGHLLDDGVTIAIRANQRAIATSGLTDLYIEVVARDTARRHWRVVYGGFATLSNDQELSLGEQVFAAPGIPTGDDVDFFFRLWDGAELIGAGGTTIPLVDGIQLAFASGPFRPGDYWTFPVRAGVPNGDEDRFLLRDQGPQGVYRFWVPLAVITWGTGTTAKKIEDCRRLFPPLTQRDCCTVRLGDGVTTIGDARTLQEAIDRLPEAGGTICVLPGRHVAGARMVKRKNVTIHGCGQFSKLVAPAPESDTADAVAVLEILGGERIRIHDLAIEAHDRGPGILVDVDDQKQGCRDLEFEQLEMVAATRSAIEIEGANGVLIYRCAVAMKDVEGQWPAITIAATDARIERNRVEVQRQRVRVTTRVALVESQPEQPAQPPEPARPVPPPPPPTNPAPPAAPNRPLDAAPDEDGDTWFEPPRYSGGLGLAIAEDDPSPQPPVEDDHRWQDSTAFILARGVDEEPVEAVDRESPAIRLQETGSHTSTPGASPGTGATTGRSEALGLSRAGLGGIWLRGGCTRVRVIDNDILGGIGHGILLGHIDVEEGGPGRRIGWVFGFGDPCAPCLPGSGVISFPGFPHADKIIPGDKLQAIEIERNRIGLMGLAGIGVFGFFERPASLPAGEMGPVITVDGLAIRSNLIGACLMRTLAPIPTALIGRMGYGVITLGYTLDLVVRDNRIEGNGIFHRQPICGLYALVTERAEISANQIVNNGLAESASGSAPLGGVYCQLVFDGRATPGQLRAPALVFHENQVRTPFGPALWCFAVGRVAATDNNLTARTSKSAAQAINISASTSGAKEPITFSDNQVFVQTESTTGSVAAIAIENSGGDVLFANNQCQLDAPPNSYDAMVSIRGSEADVRVTSCRFVDGNAVEFSALIRGDSKIVTLNHADHCLAVQSTPGLAIKLHNIEHGAVDPVDCANKAQTYFAAHPT